MWTPAPLIPAVLALTLASPAFAVRRSRVLARNCGDRGRARSRTLAHYWRFGSCGSGSASEAAGRRPSGRRRREGGRLVDANGSSHSDAPGVPYGLWEPLVNAFTSHINAIATAVPRHLLHQAEVADRAGHVFKFRTSAAGLRQCRARNPSFTVIYLHLPDFTRLGVGCDLTSLRP